MEEPTLNNEENKNPLEPNAAPLTPSTDLSTNTTTSDADPKGVASESSTTGSSFSAFVPGGDNSPSEEPVSASEVSAPSDEPDSEAEPVSKSNEPAKIDVAAAEAEPAAAPSVPVSTSTGSANVVDSPSQSTTTSLAIDNPHPTSPVAKHGLPMLVVAAIAAVVGLSGGFGLAAASGFTFKKQTAQQIAQTPEVIAKELKFPDDATVISECAKGRGKQYVRPKDIPQGPVYNVFNGKVIGIEYMLGQKDVLANKDYLNLLLEGVTYDHLNVGLLSKGHSGYPEPHYHIDVFTVSHEEASKITCQ